MPDYGLRVYDAAGRRTVDITDHLTRVLGTFTTGVNDGSINNADLSQGTPFFAVLGALPGIGYTTRYPVVTISGSTISWTFVNAPAGYRAPLECIYGVYS